MTTIFSTKKTLQNRFSKRILGMEALENREMLSVNPLLSVDYSAPDFVETSATKSSENIDTPVVASSVEFATEETTISSAPAAETNSLATVSGVTTNAATITWTKPTQTSDGKAISRVTKYTLYYIPSGGDGDSVTTWKTGIDCSTKTSWALTGLEQGETYYFKVVVTGTLRDDSSSAIAPGTIAASGSFTAEAVTLADEMAVGRPTDVKTTPSDSSVKITWKAPVNYTGGYEVKVTNLDVADKTGTFVVAAGAKMEATIKFGTENLSGDLDTWLLTSGKRYEVVITPTSGNSDGSSGYNGLASTPTNFLAQKTQLDEKPTVTANAPETPLATLFTVTPGAGKIVVTKASGNVPPGVDGYYIVVAQTGDIAGKGVADATYVTKAQFEATSGVTIGNLVTDDDYDVKIFAANSAGNSTDALTLNNGNSHYNVTAPTPVNNTPASAATITATKDANVANKVKVAWTTNDTVIGGGSSGETGYAAVSYDVYYSIADKDQWVLAGNVAASATLELTVSNLLYDTDYDFAVVANCNTNPSSTSKVAALKATAAAVKTDDAPAVDATKILTAEEVSEAAYTNGTVTFDLEAFASAKGKTNPDQYFVVLRDANKAVIANGFVPVTTTTGASLSLGNIVLTPKTQYTVEVYGVSGTTIGSAKVSTSLKVADYPAATLKVTQGTKPTINGVSITVTDRDGTDKKFYYVQYTSVADAKSKPDWSTATVEKLAPANVTTTGGTAYSLATKLDPNTQYYVRIVTSDTNVAITTGESDSWTTGSGGGLDDWADATKVVFGKEIKVKTAAVPLATVGKPGFGFDASTYNITLKTVGQTMLSAKGAGDLFGSSKPLESAQFTYKLLVSLDSKVDKVTGKLLGSAEITLGDGTNISNGLKTETYTPKNDTPVNNGQYTLEYALTGDDGSKDGILKKLGITASNASSLKNLNFQLVTTVTYSGVSFDSVTKPGKVAMPKWFV